MFDKLKDQRDVFGHKLGAALTMEQDVLDSLGDLEDEAQSDRLKQQFRHHAEETRQQITNIEQAFEALGEKPDDSTCMVSKALDKEAKAEKDAKAEETKADKPEAEQKSGEGQA